MTSKLNFIFGMVLLFAFGSAQAQVTATNGATINGTPYVDEKYVEGVIYYADKNQPAPIRYNAYQDLIEFQQNGQPRVLDPVSTIKKVQVGSSTFVPERYDISGESKLGYFEVLDSGNMTLYSKKKIVFIAARKGSALDGSDEPAQFKKSPDIYFFKIGNGKLQEVGNIKSMITSLPDKQGEMAQYAKKEKLSPRKEKDIRQFVQYYNSL